MPAKLITTISKIALIPNSVNSSLVREFHQDLIINGASERHQNNCLKAVIAFSNHLGPGMSFYNIQEREQITGFLDTKRKSIELDPDTKWITTWNHYLIHIKLFLRWLYNCRGKARDSIMPRSEWETPAIARIKEIRTKRLSPYSETEIWDKDELLTIVKYEPHIRNKAALTLFWDLDARNHEVTALKIRNIRLGERYGEGEIPHNTKTGGGPILLACSYAATDSN